MWDYDGSEIDRRISDLTSKLKEARAEKKRAERLGPKRFEDFTPKAFTYPKYTAICAVKHYKDWNSRKPRGWKHRQNEECYELGRFDTRGYLEGEMPVLMRGSRARRITNGQQAAYMAVKMFRRIVRRQGLTMFKHRELLDYLDGVKSKIGDHLSKHNIYCHGRTWDSEFHWMSDEPIIQYEHCCIGVDHERRQPGYPPIFLLNGKFCKVKASPDLEDHWKCKGPDYDYEAAIRKYEADIERRVKLMRELLTVERNVCKLPEVRLKEAA